LTYKEKIAKKSLHCSFFLTIVKVSGKKWGFVGNCPLSRVILELVFGRIVLIALHSAALRVVAGVV
jgi:hypothetical protein